MPMATNYLNFLLRYTVVKAIKRCQQDEATSPNASISQPTASSSPVFRIQERPDVKFLPVNEPLYPSQDCDFDVSQLLGSIHSASFKEQADVLLQSGNLSLVTLGDVVANHDCNAEYQELFSNKLKESRIDLAESKALQVAASHLPPSTDPLVRQLTTLVQNQTNIIAGLSFVVRFS
ncbi:unnamed protein product [Strongylus vulgaris]|uniref:Uncharacterized protein n=1 Tax=Strongylus vulgaris TaxID=40348 RepID=A0A3P7J8K2_STRVU|nr:unnamed protein product [Strongylus vulgaris]